MREMESVFCYERNEFISRERTRALACDAPLCCNSIVYKLEMGEQKAVLCQEIQQPCQPSLPHVTGFRVMGRINRGNRAECDTNRQQSVGY